MSYSLEDVLYALQLHVQNLAQEIEQSKILAAQVLIRDLRLRSEPVALSEAEFKVFSQFGDDGIIQYVINRLNLPQEDRKFVEFGVESYQESNTRFLLVNNNWSGLIIDASEAYMNAVKQGGLYWKYDLTAVSSFITRDNINSLIKNAGFEGPIGLLSIDIDGNDYWVWEAISVVNPAIVVAEYNGIFGANAPVTIPYQENFDRKAAHYSHLYWGCSLAALCHLAAKKGYAWIGCNSAGNNAYFVKKANEHLFRSCSLPLDFVAAKFREGRDENGQLNYLDQKTGFNLVKHLPVWDVAKNAEYTLFESALN